MARVTRSVRRIYLRFLLAACLIATAAFTVGHLNRSTNAASGGLVFAEFATHPYASKSGYPRDTTNYYNGTNLCPNKDFCPDGQELVDMNVDGNGILVAGYGDWDVNSDSFGNEAGRVGAVPLDLKTKTWGDMSYAGSEAITNIRKFAGKFYIPTIDPSDKAALNQSGGNVPGFLSNENNWKFTAINKPAVHVADIVRINSNEYWAVGGAEFDGDSSKGAATAWRTTNAGNTWTVMKQETNPSGNQSGYERYYWVAELGNKVYMQAQSINPQSSMKVYDISKNEWSNALSDNFCSSSNGKDVVVLDETIVCASGTPSFYDGESAVKQKPLPNGEFAMDSYVDDGSLYFLTTQKKIYKLDGVGGQYQYLGTATDDAQSVATYDDYVYVGGTGGKVYRSTTTMADSPDVTKPEINDISPNKITIDSGTVAVTITGNNFDNYGEVTLGGKKLSIESWSNNSITVKLKSNDFSIGEKTMVVSSGGVSGIKTRAVEFLPVPVSNTPTINKVSLVKKSSNYTTLRVSGYKILKGFDDTTDHVWAMGLRHKLVKLNSEPIPACVSNAQYKNLSQHYDTSNFTKKTPCYVLLNYDTATNRVSSAISNNSFDIRLPSGSSSITHGSVQLAGGSYSNKTLGATNAFSY